MKFCTIFSALVVLAFSAYGELKWEPLCEPGCGGAIVSVACSPHNPDHVVGGGDMLGTCVSFDDGENWKPGLGLPSYEMADVTFHPADKDVVWIGSCMGPMKSIDGGRTWEWKRKGMCEPSRGRYSCKIEKVLFDPKNPARMFAFGGSHRVWGKIRDGYGDIYESNDAGETWELKKTLMKDGERENIISAQFSPNGKLQIVTDLSGWVGHETPGHVTFLTFHPTDAKTIWITVDPIANEGSDFTPGAIFKSTDGGKTWESSDNGIAKNAKKDKRITSNFSKVAVSAAAPDELYVSDKGWAHPRIWKSVDGGKSWEMVLECAKVVRACFASGSLDLAAHPTRKGEIWGWNSEYYLRTTDGGETWKDMTAVQPDPENNPDNWRGRGWTGWCSQNCVFDPYREGRSIVLANDGCHGWLSEDGMKSWRYTKADVTPWGGGHCAAFTKDGFIYVTTGQFGSNAGVLVSSDDGKTFASMNGQSRGLLERNEGAYGSVYAMPTDGKRAWVLASGTLRKTEDGGKSWELVTEFNEVSGFVGDPSQEGRFYMVSSRRLYVYEDGKGFKDVGLDWVPSGRIEIDSKGRVFLIEERGKKSGLYRYDPTDGSLTRLLENKIIGAVAADPSDPDRILVGLNDYPFHDFAGGGGVIMSEDDGKTWHEENIGLANRRINALSFDPFNPKTIIAGSIGTGFFKATLPR